MDSDIGRECLQYLNDEIDWMSSYLVLLPLVQRLEMEQKVF